MDRFEGRWKRRMEGVSQQEVRATVTVSVSEQVTVMGVKPDQLWRLVWDPATSPLVFDHVVSAFTVPGTPSGRVGEMQMHVVKGHGDTLIGMIEEVVELGPGYRAVTRSRSTGRPATSTTLLLPLDNDGCVLRHSTELTVAADTANAVREETRTSTQRYLSRVRDLAQASLR